MLASQLVPPHTPETWNTYIDRLRSNFPLELLKKKIFLRWKAVVDPVTNKVRKVPVPTYDKVAEYMTFAQASRFVPGFQGLGVANVEQDFTICDLDSPPAHSNGITPSWSVDPQLWEGWPTINPNTGYSYGCSSRTVKIYGYVERSPSGKGLRWFYLGQLPDVGSTVQIINDIEVYRAKWATITGDIARYNDPTPFERVVSNVPDFLAARWIVQANAAKLVRESVSDGEPGPFDRAMLLERLEAWKKFVPGFSFVDTKPVDPQESDYFLIPCPGVNGWPDGNKHSDNDKSLSKAACVWVRNGFPVFHCFHAHCAEKTWKDFQNFHDPDRLWHTVDESLENWLDSVGCLCKPR